MELKYNYHHQCWMWVFHQDGIYVWALCPQNISDKSTGLVNPEAMRKARKLFDLSSIKLQFNVDGFEHYQWENR